MTNIIRSCEIIDIPFEVNIQHNHLDSTERVENSQESIEIFKISVRVEWLGKETMTEFSDLFNYAELYKFIQSQKRMVLDKPLEHILDLISAHCLESAKKQSIDLSYVKISLQRPGLIDGNIVMERVAKSDK